MHYVILGMICCDDDLNLFILHYIYLPRINHTINIFIDSWNNHPVRTMKNWSPRKIWTNGMIDARNRHINHIQELQDNSEELSNDDLEWYGMDWSAPAPTDDGLSTVEVNDINFELNDYQLQQLTDIDPLKESSTFGIDLFTKALEIFNE